MTSIARDIRPKRDVAIKVLPGAFARDPERERHHPELVEDPTLEDFAAAATG